MKYFIFTALLMLGLTAAAQKTVLSSIHFNSDEFGLDNEDHLKLKNLANELKKTGFYQLQLNGHTDHDASDDYNRFLSQKRALEVKQFLINEGLAAEKIITEWQGEAKPIASNLNTKGKEKNRRVDIELIKFEYASANELAKAITQKEKQKIIIDSRKLQTITAKEGTQFIIPENAFCKMDGTPVSGNVTLLIEEIYTPEAAIHHGITTESEGQILESGGMFKFEATQNGEPLNIRSGKEVGVNLPAKELKNGMTVFTAVKNSKGITEWKNTGAPFTAKSEPAIDIPTYRINENLLRKFKMNPNYSDTGKTKISWTYTFRNPPPRPYIGRAPKPLPPLGKRQLFSRFENLILPNSVKEMRYQKELEKRNQWYLDQKEKYQQKLAKYNAALLKYKKDSIAFELAEQENFSKFLATQKAILRNSLRALEIEKLNKAIEIMAKKSEQGKLTAPLPFDYLSKLARVNVFDAKTVEPFKLAIKKIEKYESMPIASIIEQNHKSKRISIKQQEFHERQLFFENSTLKELFRDEAELIEMFANAQLEISKKRKDAGILEKVDMVNLYAGLITKTGLYNCDKFNSIPPVLMADVSIRAKGDCLVYFYIPSMKSTIYAYKSLNGYYCRLPKNREIQMILIQTDPETGAMFERQKFVFEDNFIYEAKPKPIKTQDLKASLAAL